ncbi:hypothetical protein [Streptomyces malaysiensis]|uniref:hypothetical protein n=1 Tax=Streptomyces malaysiensis TaxID=92644 RepID=UPI0036B17444
MPGRSDALTIFGRERVYTAEQSSNTVSVIDPSTNTALGTIKLGDQRVGTPAVRSISEELRQLPDTAR